LSLFTPFEFEYIYYAINKHKRMRQFNEIELFFNCFLYVRDFRRKYLYPNIKLQWCLSHAKKGIFISIKSFAKLKLGIYYFRKSVSRFSLLSYQMLYIAFLERKNQKKRFFLSKSMPNFNFAKVQLVF